MNEHAKIAEAKYFYSQMLSLVNERPKFNYNLSAFLSAARSALQYALKEARTKTGGQDWYNAQMASNPAVKFLKDKRDSSTHATPVEPPARIEIRVSETIGMTDAASATLVHEDGRTEVIRCVSPAPPAPQAPQEGKPSVTYQYVFNDWPGKEDVLTLCSIYLAAVEAIVADGVSNGFLTS